MTTSIPFVYFKLLTPGRSVITPGFRCRVEIHQGSWRILQRRYQWDIPASPGFEPYSRVPSRLTAT